LRNGIRFASERWQTFWTAELEFTISFLILGVKSDYKESNLFPFLRGSE
jgi:hypothetical protein